MYGYNLRVTAAGTYRIRFNSTPTVTVHRVLTLETFDGNNAYLDIVVVRGGGGGGGKKGGGKPLSNRAPSRRL